MVPMVTRNNRRVIPPHLKRILLSYLNRREADGHFDSQREWTVRRGPAEKGKRKGSEKGQDWPKGKRSKTKESDVEVVPWVGATASNRPLYTPDYDLASAILRERDRNIQHAFLDVQPIPSRCWQEGAVSSSGQGEGGSSWNRASGWESSTNQCYADRGSGGWNQSRPGWRAMASMTGATWSECFGRGRSQIIDKFQAAITYTAAVDAQT